MTLSTVSLEDGNSITGKDLRQWAAWTADSGLSTDSYVISGFKVSQQASPASTVRVALGRATVKATESGKFGAYPIWNDATLTSPSFTATSGNGRKDFLIARVTSGDPVLEVVQGTAAASPAEPAITGDNYIVLALITLPSSTTNITDAMITDRRVFGGKWAQPWGRVFSVTSTSGQGSITSSWVDLTSLTTGTLANVANRKWKITAFASAQSTVANDVIVLGVRDGAATELQKVYRAHVSGSNMQDLTAIVPAYTTTGASITIKASMIRHSGSGTISTLGTAGPTQFLEVEDVGPAANPD